MSTATVSGVVAPVNPTPVNPAPATNGLGECVIPTSAPVNPAAPAVPATPAKPATGWVKPSAPPNSSVSPIVSKQEILLKVAAGQMAIEEASALLASAAEKSAGPPPRVKARRTAKDTLWISLGYRSGPGCQNSTTLPRIGWESIVKLVKDGTIPKLLADWDGIPLSASAKLSAKGGAA